MAKTWRLKRRTFLRGAGAALALPMLDAMEPAQRVLASSGAGAAATTTPPVRFATLYFPNGAYMQNWIPAQDGEQFELPFSLTPLEKIRSEVLVLSGLGALAGVTVVRRRRV